MLVSCAATICYFPARFSHVSVQIRQCFVSLLSLAIKPQLSAINSFRSGPMPRLEKSGEMQHGKEWNDTRRNEHQG